VLTHTDIGVAATPRRRRQGHHRHCGERAVTSADGPTRINPGAHPVHVAGRRPDDTGHPADGRGSVLAQTPLPTRTDALSDRKFIGSKGPA
jgi:hypothetical protein